MESKEHQVDPNTSQIPVSPLEILSIIEEIKEIYEKGFCFHCWTNSGEKHKLELVYVGMTDMQVCPKCRREGYFRIEAMLNYIFSRLG